MKNPPPLNRYVQSLRRHLRGRAPEFIPCPHLPPGGVWFVPECLPLVYLNTETYAPLRDRITNELTLS